MGNKIKAISVMVAMLLMIGILPANVTVNAAEETNYIVNGDFETDSPKDYKPDNWTASAGIDPYTWLDNSTTKVLRIKSAGTAMNGTISQAVTGIAGGRLPDGVYTLEAKVQGDPTEINSLKLYAKDTGGSDVTSSDFNTSITTGSSIVIKLENINVTAGGCTVGISADLKGTLAAWTWTLDIDDVSFYKTREIGENIPTIDSVDNPAPITTVVNEAPNLPKTATAHLSNGLTTDVAVSWTAPESSLYTGIGTIGSAFTVVGTVNNSDIAVEVSVNVYCKSFDLNGDKTVNVGDLAVAAYYYGKASGESGWDSAKASDVNGDGIVDASDLQFISNGIIGG